MLRAEKSSTSIHWKLLEWRKKRCALLFSSRLPFFAPSPPTPLFLPSNHDSLEQLICRSNTVWCHSEPSARVSRSSDFPDLWWSCLELMMIFGICPYQGKPTHPTSQVSAAKHLFFLLIQLCFKLVFLILASTLQHQRLPQRIGQSETCGRWPFAPTIMSKLRIQTPTWKLARGSYRL